MVRTAQKLEIVEKLKISAVYRFKAYGCNYKVETINGGYRVQSDIGLNGEFTTKNLRTRGDIWVDFLSQVEN